MGRKFLNLVFKQIMLSRMRSIHGFMQNPSAVQQRWFQRLIERGRSTEFGKMHQFRSIKNQDDFRRNIQIREYDQIKPFINRMMKGEKDVLWPGRIFWYAKSSGTTSDRSKFIPVSDENLKFCHIKGSKDTMSILYSLKPESSIFRGRNLIMGGTLYDFEENLQTKTGDISAVMVSNMPFYADWFFTPDRKTALLSDFEEKIDRMVEITVENRNMTMFGGVPTWTQVLFKKVLEYTGAANLFEVWPHLQVYIHGGVGFEPYRDLFSTFLPDPNFTYLETYNASEGYFGIQDNFDGEGMLLLLDNGIFYEFLPQSEWFAENPKTLGLQDVEKGCSYGLVITTNSGLWRYNLGDTIEFSSLQPYRFKITGRINQYINAFGEEVMVSNTEEAVKNVCRKTRASVKDYTVAPIYLAGDTKGGHEWYVEFEKAPTDTEEFAIALDHELQAINSDYEAKRYRDLALERLTLHSLPPGTFEAWMKYRGKLGGQNKVPRLSNDRQVVEQLKTFLESYKF